MYGRPSMTWFAPNGQSQQRIKKRKLLWHGHVSRHNSISEELLQGTVERKRRRGRPRKMMWLDNIKHWTRLSVDNLLDSTRDRTQWRKMVAEASVCAPD